MPPRRFTDEDVRQLRLAAAEGVTTTQLAAASGISRSALNAILRGDRRSSAGGPLRPRRDRLTVGASEQERMRVLRARLLARIRWQPGTDCWLIGTGLDSQGYATLSVGGNVSAHRASWLVFRGDVPPGLMVDHVCHNEDLTCGGGSTCRHRACVNPSHLRVTDLASNTRAGRAGLWQRRKTLCPKGHVYAEGTNTIWVQRADGGWSRRCRPCGNAATLRWWRNRKDVAADKPPLTFADDRSRSA